MQGPEKELFFRNMYAGGKEASGFFVLMQIMYHGDMRPGLPVHIKWLERLVSDYRSCSGHLYYGHLHATFLST